MSVIYAIEGYRIDCRTGEERWVDLTVEIKPRSSRRSAVVGVPDEPQPEELWLFIENGVTGYESASWENLLRDAKQMPGGKWMACFGTKNVWDTLEVPMKEILRLSEEFEREKR